MLSDSLGEYLTLAELGLQYRKPSNGVLGYSSATSLFAFVDAVGSYHRDHDTFRIRIEGQPVPITTAGEHFFILNSDYFGCDLTRVSLKEIYETARCPLTHNAVLAEGLILSAGEPMPDIAVTRDGVEIYLPGFLQRCQRALPLFLAAAPGIVPGSRALLDLERRLRATGVRRVSERRVPGPITNFGGSTPASAVGTPPNRFRSRRRI
jgi:hypothetical protein